MNTESLLNVPKESRGQTNLTETVRRIQQACINCSPLSMLECMTSCSVWKLKNEFRDLYRRMQDPSFATRLLNTIKNKRRLQILRIISSSQCSLPRLQEELKKTGFYHSQKTITDEYLAPLLDTELVNESRNMYHATLMGFKIAELAKDALDIGELLPPHSECYEETALITLIDHPRIYEELVGVASTGNPTRILSRLQAIGLLDTSAEKDHVFFFRTRRSPSMESFSPTEKRVYEGIPKGGISARKLALKTAISLRRTYKYIRRLKGKKMVFVREKPKTYSLTDRGNKLAVTIRSIFDIIQEAQAAAKRLIDVEQTPEQLRIEDHEVRDEKRRAAASISPSAYIAE